MPAEERCPICLRPLEAGPSVDRHHLVPRSEGGRATVLVHRVCHRKLHTLWSERELAALWHDPALIRAHPDIARFARWLKNKPPTFYTRTAPMRRR